MKNAIWYVQLIFYFFLVGCTDDKMKEINTEDLFEVTYRMKDIRKTSALCEGTMSFDGRSEILKKGVCWSNSSEPTINDFNLTLNEIMMGYFKFNITGLENNSTYYVRVFIITSTEIFYSDVKFFTTSLINFNPNLNYGRMTDIEGNEYKTIIIGEQKWLAENIRTTLLNNLDSIKNVESKEIWAGLKIPAYVSYNRTKNIDSILTFGLLYNWYAINTQKLCPNGWHVPSKNDWRKLIDYLGGESSTYKLREIDESHWNYSWSAINNESGFTALPGGLHHYEGIFQNIGYSGYWWGSTELNEIYASMVSMNANYYNILMNNMDKRFGLSVRCLCDTLYNNR